MDLSERLLLIEKLIPLCHCAADIGTDHAYVPILAVSHGKCQHFIASDINKGPVEKARKNVFENGFEQLIDTRLGPGLSVLSRGEAEVIIIAGMGGHMISKILSQDIDIAKSAKLLILQPMKHQDVLRRELCRMDFQIEDEELVKEDQRFYQIIMARYGHADSYQNKSEYVIGRKLIEKKHALLKEYIEYNKGLLIKVLDKLNPRLQHCRYEEVNGLLKEMEEIEKCL